MNTSGPISFAPMPMQPPTDFYVSSIAGNVVTFRWTTLGPAATAFVIEGGINPGEVLASIPTGRPYPIFTLTVPSGSFHLRVRAVHGSDQSGPSNELPIHVNVPRPPSAPANLVGLVNGASLALAWRNTFAGAAPTSLVLDITGSFNGSIPLGNVDGFSFNGVPGGTYTFAVRAINAAGSSAPSNAIMLTFPGPCSGAPNAPANLLAYSVGNSLQIVWDPATAGPAMTNFVVNVNGPVGGSVPTTARSLGGGVPPGTYTVNVTAVNACGAATTAGQNVTVP